MHPLREIPPGGTGGGNPEGARHPQEQMGHTTRACVGEEGPLQKGGEASHDVLGEVRRIGREADWPPLYA